MSMSCTDSGLTAEDGGDDDDDEEEEEDELAAAAISFLRSWNL